MLLCVVVAMAAMSPAPRPSLVALLMGVKTEAAAPARPGKLLNGTCPDGGLQPTAKCSSKSRGVPAKPKRAAQPRVPKAAASDTLVAPPLVALPSAVLPAAVVAPPLASPPGVVPPLTSSPSTVRSKKATPPKPKAQRVPKAKAAVPAAPVEPDTPPPSVSPVSGLANGGPTEPSLVPPVSGLASGGSGVGVPSTN